LTTAASSLSSSPPVVVQARNNDVVVLTAVAARETIYYYYTDAANVSGIASYERPVTAAARASVNSWRGAGAITKAGAATGTSCARGTVCGLAAADTAVERRADERESRGTYGKNRKRRKGED
jgi:hypothetical protein